MESLLRWLGFETVELVAPLPEEECLQILRNSISGEFSLFGNHAILGRVGEHDFRLRKRPSFFFRNSFQTYLYAETAGVGRSTMIRCRFGVHILVLILGVAWFLFFLVTSLDRLLRVFDRPQPIEAAGMEVFGSLFLLGFLAVVFVISRLFARSDNGLLLDFLRSTIGAVQPRGMGRTED